MRHEHEHHDEHDHSHEHEHEHGRSYADIRALIEASDLSDFVKKHALSIFHRVAVAEAKIHGTPVNDIGFHEVGALDSIADIICACVGIEELGVEKVFVSALADGHGWVDCAHGRFPIPAMATLEILRGIPVGQIDEPFEIHHPDRGSPRGGVRGGFRADAAPEGGKNRLRFGFPKIAGPPERVAGGDRRTHRGNRGR